MFNRMIREFVRPFLSLAAIASFVILSGCGGGGSPIQNPFDRPPAVPPLGVTPTSFTAYFNNPVLLVAFGGRPPYQLVSNNQSIIPPATSESGNFLIVPANVTAPTTVTLTVIDSAGQTVSVTVTVQPAPLLRNMTIYGDGGSDCGQDVVPDPVDGVLRAIGRVCSGQTGVVRISTVNPAGGGLAGRQVRFDVREGTYAILTDDPSQPTVNTRIVTTDQFGIASVRIRANTNSPTAFALISATDVITNNRVDSAFAIVQLVTEGNTLQVLPETVTITGPFQNECSSGAQVTYYVFGGTPPYRVQSVFPGVFDIIGAPVPTNGGGFTVTTRGACTTGTGNLVVTDATGRTDTASLVNEPGTRPRPTPLPPPPGVSPATVCLAPGASAGVTVTGTTFDATGNPIGIAFVAGSSNPAWVTVTPTAGTTVATLTLARQPGAPNGQTVTITVSSLGGTSTVTVNLQATCT